MKLTPYNHGPDCQSNCTTLRCSFLLNGLWRSWVYELRSCSFASPWCQIAKTKFRNYAWVSSWNLQGGMLFLGFSFPGSRNKTHLPAFWTKKRLWDRGKVRKKKPKNSQKATYHVHPRYMYDSIVGWVRNVIQPKTGQRWIRVAAALRNYSVERWPGLLLSLGVILVSSWSDVLPKINHRRKRGKETM